MEFATSPAGHGHPSSLSEPGRLAATAIEEARAKIAFLIGAKSANQIIFTANCTQACEWGLEIFFQLDQSDIICSPIEHSAVKEAFEKIYQRTYKSEPEYMAVGPDGLVDRSTEYQKMSCIHMQNEIGVIQPLKEFKRKFMFSDMSQSLGKVGLNVSDIGVDIAVFGAHKFGGPGSVGFIYLKDPTWWRAFGTGSRYFMDRPGTPDVAGIVASAVALEDAIDTLSERQKNMIMFQKTVEKGLKAMGHKIVAEYSPRAWNTTFVNVPSQAMVAIMKLGEKGIHLGLGSACGSMHAGASTLMKVLGKSGTVHDYLRISQWGEYDEMDAIHFLNIFNSLDL